MWLLVEFVVIIRLEPYISDHTHEVIMGRTIILMSSTPIYMPVFYLITPLMYIKTMGRNVLLVNTLCKIPLIMFI